MTNTVLQHRKSWAAAIGAAALALATTPFVTEYLGAMDGGLISSAYAQDHGSGGGHDSGGGSSGGHTSGGSSGGHSSGGGHDSGASGGHSGGSGGSGGHSSGGGHDSGASGGHSGGSGGSGGHSGGSGGSHASGGGGHSGGGGGGGGGGHDGGGGGERARHGTNPGHQGHASGTHSGSMSAHDNGSDRRFGGGSGLASSAAVPEGVGRYGPSYGQGPSAHSRFRYWGGWALPDTPDDPGDGDPTQYAVDTTSYELATPGGGGPSASPGLNSAGRCDDVGAGMTADAQYSKANLARMKAAYALIAPEAAAAGEMPSPYLLANFQAELTKANPDMLLAGTYLGLVAKEPVTPDAVKKVCWRMCAPVGGGAAEQIAQVAENQRLAQSAPTKVSGLAAEGR